MAADISADTGPGLRMRTGQPDVERDRAGLRAEPDTASTKALLRTHSGRCADGSAMTSNDWLPARVASRTNRGSAPPPELRHHRVPLPGALHLAPMRMIGEDEEGDVIAISSQRNKNVVTWTRPGRAAGSSRTAAGCTRPFGSRVRDRGSRAERPWRRCR